MEVEIKKELGAEVSLKASSGGAYEIVADGKAIFSKLELKRFPREGEIIKLLKDL